MIMNILFVLLAELALGSFGAALGAGMATIGAAIGIGRIGGSAMEDPECVENVLKDVAFMECVGLRPVLVHGGGKAISLSDSNGTIIDNDGIDAEKLQFVMELKNVRRGRISEYTKKFPKAKYV